MKKRRISITTIQESLLLLKQEYEAEGYETELEIKYNDVFNVRGCSYAKLNVTYEYEGLKRTFSKLFLSDATETVCKQEIPTYYGMPYAKEQFRSIFKDRQKD